MSDGALRPILRRVLPRPLYSFGRFIYRMISGWYLRQAVSRFKNLERTLHLHVEQTDAHAEILDFFLRRMQRLEDETEALARPVGDVSEGVDELRQSVDQLRAEVYAWSQPVKAITGKPLLYGESPFAAEPRPAEEPVPAPPPQAMKIAVVCRSFGRRCGIAEYSSLLAERLGGLAVNSVADLPLDTDVVFVEYEHTLYDPPMDIVREVDFVKPSTLVIVDAHTITPEVFDELRWHSLVGMKRGRFDAPGAIRLSLFQQIPVAEWGQNRNNLRLGSFGFAFPHKRYEDVIKLARRLNIGATILASQNDSTAEARAVSSEYIRMLKRLEGDGVDVIEDFLPMDEVLARLRECSHLLSCMEDNGAQSASMRIMAAAGRPLIALRTQQAEEIGAILVDDLDSITREFLLEHQELAQPYDGIADYFTAIERAAAIRALATQIQHSDEIYLDDPIQMERLDWLRKNIVGKAIDIGVGNGFSTNYVRAVAGVEIRPDRLAYASLRFPHIDVRLMDAKIQTIPGFDTVILGEIVEHMELNEARAMISLWAETRPRRILITTPNAGKPDYDPELVHNPEHIWEPTEELLRGLIPSGYRAEINASSRDDFLLAIIEGRD